MVEEVNVEPGVGLVITPYGIPGVEVGVAVGRGSGVGDGVGVTVGDGLGAAPPTARIPFPVRTWSSGLMIVTLYAVFDAFVVFRSSETCVGSMYVALLTITKPLAPPLTVA